MQTTPVLCGVEGHGDECTCDVVITKPTETNFHFTEVWHASLVARHLGYKGGGYADLADFLEALGAAYDATRNLDNIDADWLDGVRGSGLAARVREALAQGESILDLPDMLGDSFARIVATLTNCQPLSVWTWGDIEWLEWEDEMNSAATHSAWVLARRFNISGVTASTLIEAYGKQLSSQVRVARKGEIDDLIAEHHQLPFSELYALVVESGFDYAPATIKSFRRRHRAKLRNAA